MLACTVPATVAVGLFDIALLGNGESAHIKTSKLAGRPIVQNHDCFSVENFPDREYRKGNALYLNVAGVNVAQDTVELEVALCVGTWTLEHLILNGPSGESSTPFLNLALLPFEIEGLQRKLGPTTLADAFTVQQIGGTPGIDEDYNLIARAHNELRVVAV
jgi:hypothetical protein